MIEILLIYVDTLEGHDCFITEIFGNWIEIYKLAKLDITRTITGEACDKQRSKEDPQSDYEQVEHIVIAITVDGGEENLT